ncbi:hypothetical protein H6758_03130 [Candidatus Nomurabacteria bacterium]|nr:hypothetical protein [Candidatus Nomurabacteria bacterium]
MNGKRKIAMVIIRFVRGSETRDMAVDLVTRDEAREILVTGHKAGFDWKIEYRLASEIEAHLWMAADFTARILRALMRGLPVRFDGVTWFRLDQAGEIEDVIVNSGAVVTIESDDDNGLVIIRAGQIH